MKIFLLTLFIAAASANNCSGVYLKQTYFDVEILKEDMKNIKSLVFNIMDSTAYFISEDEDKKTTLGYIKLDDKSSGVINTVPNVTSIAVDNEKNRLYVGTTDGVYKINMTTVDKVPEKVPVINDSIKSVFVRKRTIYYVNEKGEGWKYDFCGKFVQTVYELRSNLVVKLIRDDSFNYHYLDASKKVSKVKITTGLSFPFGNKSVNDIVVNTKFRAYVCAEDGLYAFIKYSYEYDTEKISDLVVDKMAFVNEEEPIYVVNDTLYRLIKNPEGCKTEA